MVRKPPHNQAGCIVEPYNASRHPNIHIQCLVRGRQRTPRAHNFFLWAKIANAWLPIQIYGSTSKCRNFNSKKIPFPRIFQVWSILHVHVGSSSWIASQSLKHYYITLFSFFFSTLCVTLFSFFFFYSVCNYLVCNFFFFKHV